MGVCGGGVLSGVAVAFSLVFGVGGIVPEVLHTSFVGVFAFGGIIDFSGRFWIFFARAFCCFCWGDLLRSLYAFSAMTPLPF